jgi:hypothetical protein
MINFLFGEYFQIPVDFLIFSKKTNTLVLSLYEWAKGLKYRTC